MYGLGENGAPPGGPPPPPTPGAPPAIPTPIPGATDEASCAQHGGTWQGLPPPAPPGMGVCLSGALPPIPGVPPVPGGLPGLPPGVQKPEIPGYVTKEHFAASLQGAATQCNTAAASSKRMCIYVAVGAGLAGVLIGAVVGKNMKK